MRTPEQGALSSRRRDTTAWQHDGWLRCLRPPSGTPGQPLPDGRFWVVIGPSGSAIVLIGDAIAAVLACCVPDSRPVTEVDAARVRAAVAGVRTAQETLETAVAQASKNGASVRSVAALGLSANTVQKYGRAHGWPTEENRDRPDTP